MAYNIIIQVNNVAAFKLEVGRSVMCVVAVCLIIQVNAWRGRPDYTGQQCGGCIREVGLIIQVNICILRS